MPVWLMCQVGGCLPEYQRLREKALNFMAFCKTPELACEVTLQPLERFSLDAAIIFSDILTIPDAIGVDLQIEPSVGPVILNPIRTMEHFERLRDPDVEAALSYVFETINLVIKALARQVPLIRFAGSPWTFGLLYD